MLPGHSSLQLLRDLIHIATGKVAMKLIHKKLGDQAELRDIAHTILEVTGICPMCDQETRIRGRPCPSCHAQQSRYISGRIERYKLILHVVPEILSEILEMEEKQAEKQ